MTGTQETTTVKKIDRMFRHHDTAPDGIDSALYRQLTREWADLHAQPTTAITLRRWGRTEPALAGFSRPGDIVDTIDTADHDRKNDLLLALLRLFQTGQQLAGRVVLQALLPKLAKTGVHTSLCTSAQDTWSEDRRNIVLAEFWDVMATYPIGRRGNSVASNLALDTLHRVSRVRCPADDVPVDPHDFRTLVEYPGITPIRRTWLAALAHDGPDPDRYHPDEALTADADLLAVITWARTTSAITAAEAHLLTAAYAPARTRGFGFADTADDLGLTPAAVRKRCSRAAAKLTAAVHHELAAGEPARTIRVA